jgi:hypothetical protein
MVTGVLNVPASTSIHSVFDVSEEVLCGIDFGRRILTPVNNSGATFLRLSKLIRPPIHDPTPP